jgi:hypothetical protein
MWVPELFGHLGVAELDVQSELGEVDGRQEPGQRPTQRQSAGVLWAGADGVVRVAHVNDLFPCVLGG